MKTDHTIKTLLAALLLAAAPSGTQAASLIADGDFENLPVGTAPDLNKPAGHWFIFPELPESAASQVTIAPEPAGGTGNAVRFSLAANENSINAVVLINKLARPVTAASGQILNVSFDIYAEPGAVGPSLFLPKDDEYTRSAQLEFDSSGSLQTREWSAQAGATTVKTLISTYPRGVWHTVRLELDVARSRYNFYWSEKGQPVSVTHSNLNFWSAPPIGYVNQFWVVRFRDTTAAVRGYVDNIRVTTDPAITPMNADLAVGGSTTLQLLNLKTNSTIQWQFNSTDIDTATNANLELSNGTTNHSGSYRAVVTTGTEVVITDPSTVRILDRLTITTPPQNITAVSGTTTGFSVTAAGPLPVTYQWQRDGTNLVGKTTRFLTFSATVAAAGDYSVVVSDANGSVVSQPTTLTVLVPATVIQAPLSQSVVAGGSVTFSAALNAASTAPFTYEWRKGTSFANSTLVRRTTLSPEHTAFLTLNNVKTNASGTYRLYLANAASPTITDTSLSRAWTLTVLPDTDGDGLPDAWETANGLNPNDPSDSTTDADGDGLSNVAEYRSGTSATNVASGLKLESLTPTNGQAVVSFAAAANQTYTVEWSDQLSGGSWQKLGDVIARSTDHIETLTDSNAAAPSRFYRIVTPRRP